MIPSSGSNLCRLRVGDSTRQWLTGRVSVFDTSIYHDAHNDSDEVRYVLMLRVWHPDLSEVERKALQYTFDCLDVPGLLSEEEVRKRGVYGISTCRIEVKDERTEKACYSILPRCYAPQLLAGGEVDGGEAGGDYEECAGGGFGG